MAGIFVVLSPTTVTGATTVTLLRTGDVEVDGSEGAGAEDPPPPPLTTAFAVFAEADADASEVPMSFVAVTVNV